MYIYDAVGTKLRKTVSGITTDYAGNYVYKGGVLQFFNTAEGYVEPVSAGSTTFVYVYQYKDHLGNVRLSYADSNGDGLITATGPGAEIREENNYYPFGLKHKGYNFAVNGKDHKYGFGNKEEQDELGLGWIDITARNYDPALGRWMNLDPLAEKYPNISLYTYVANSPIFFVDPDGKEISLAPSFKSNGERRHVRKKDGLDKGQRRSLKKLQRLTNDKLSINPNTGIVSITVKGGENKRKELSFGTGLVSKAISETENIMILERNDGGKGNQTTANNRENASNGKGSDSTIFLDNGNTVGGLDENGNRTRPEFIGLGHELIHAVGNAEGIVDITERPEITDPDSEPQPGETIITLKSEPITNEEIRARTEENKLRKEHKRSLRRIPE